MSRGGAVTYIYALCAPDGGEVRYVGKADNPKARLSNHMAPTGLAIRTHKAHWIASLKQRGLRPHLVILERVAFADWPEAERDWIAEFRRVGARLTNTTDGGEAPMAGRKHTPEARRRIAAAQAGKTLSPGHAEKLAAHHRGRKRSAETRARIGAKSKGRVCSEETKAKIRSKTAGRPKSAETRARMREAWVIRRAQRAIAAA